MSSDTSADTPAPPMAWTPRWLRPALLAAAAALLVAVVALATANHLDSLCWPENSTSWQLPSSRAQKMPPMRWPWKAPAPLSSEDQSFYIRPLWSYGHAMSAPGDWWGVLANGSFTLRLYLPRVFIRDPVAAVTMGVVTATFYLLVPVALLVALFCARLGVEQRRAPETGTLPGLLLFGVLISGVGLANTLPPAWPAFVRSVPDGAFFLWGQTRGFSPFLHVGASTFALLLLACFAVVRADPPGLGGFGWTLIAGVFSALCVYGEPGALGSAGALGLYVWWSAGWRRALGFIVGAAVLGGLAAGGHNVWEPSDHFHSSGYADRLPFAVLFDPQSGLLYAAVFLAVTLLGYRLRHWMPTNNPRMPKLGPLPIESAPPPGPAVPAPLPVASAHRMIGVLLFVALMGLPAAVTSTMKQGGVINGWELIAVPLAVAAALALTAWMESAGNLARRNVLVVLGLVVFVVLGNSAREIRHLAPARTQNIRTLLQSMQRERMPFP